MKLFIVLASTFVTLASASSYSRYGAPMGSYADNHQTGYSSAPSSSSYGQLVSTGQSSQFRAQDNYGNYQFGYDESHADGGSSRREESNGDVKRGSYSLSDADGRLRTVNYVADNTGFHAHIRTNEPGVGPRDPADVYIHQAGAYSAAPIRAATGSYQQQVAPISYGVGRATVGYAAPAPAYTQATYSLRSSQY